MKIGIGVNLIYLGGRIIGLATAQELIQSFLKANFIRGKRHLRRLQKVEQLEK